MRYLLISWLLFASLITSGLCAQNLGAQIDGIMAQHLPHASLGIIVQAADSGRVLYRKNSDKLFSPASTMKLFTATALLLQFKPDAHFFTTLSEKDHNIYFTFNGSPSFTADNLRELVQDLHHKKGGVIDGDIIIDDSRFKAPYYPNGLTYDDLGWYYSAPDSAVILNENAETFIVQTAKKLGGLVSIKPKNPESNLTLINEVITVNREMAKNHCSLHIELKENNTIHLFGCVSQQKEPVVLKLALPEPLLLAKRLIKKTLTEQKIVFKGRIRQGKTPADSKIISQYQSDPLSKLLSHMLRESDNLYANSLSRQLAYAITKEGSHKQAVFAIKSILTQHTKIDFKQIELADGMGSRYNLVTPEQMALLLSHVYSDPKIRPIFLNALPRSGVSGTLKERMKKTHLAQHVYAKTGTMHDISALSGYIIEPGTTPLIFSIMINGINQPISEAKKVEELILLAIAKNNRTG